MQTHWRLALMFDEASHDLAKLRKSLGQARNSISSATSGHHVRMGVTDRHPDLGVHAQRHDDLGVAGVDGAIEITVSNNRNDEIPEICGTLRQVLEGFCDPATVHVMAGPVHHMVPVRRGKTFLSLAFRRDPAGTSEQFQHWWYDHHSKLAIPVLGQGLLAYDQVHVEPSVSKEAIAAFGAAPAEYDAYDNLTWADRYGFLHSISDALAMAPVYSDEIGWIDPIGKRSGIMVEID
jgi:EthD domain